MRLDAKAIHGAVDWPDVLKRLGIAEEFLRNKHGPCPACGGRDRFRFDNLGGRGGFYCNCCGAGDGFKLLRLVHDWTFAEARRRVIEIAGLEGAPSAPRAARTSRPGSGTPAGPTGRVDKLLNTATAPGDVADALNYLRGRALWPLPSQCSLRAHAPAKDWADFLHAKAST